MTRLLFLGLGLLASIFLAVIALELDAGGPAEDVTGIVPIRHAPLAQARAPTEDPVDHTDEWVEGVLARPLFSRDRRPTPVEAKAGGEPAVSSLPRLTGVLVGPFGRSAIFAPAAEGGKAIIVAEGASIGPYTVQTIAPGHVTVDGPEGTRELEPSYDAATRSALLVERPQPQPQLPPQVPQPNLPPGMAQGRPGVLGMRPGSQFQRALSAIRNAQPNPERGSE